MSIVNVSRRLEIAFWVVFTTLARDKRIPLLLLTMIIIAGIFTLVVLLVSLPVVDYFVFNQPEVSASAIPAWEENGQRNVLLVLVDQLDADDPRLEAVWLVVYDPLLMGLRSLPIYPAPLENTPAAGRDLADLFFLEPDGTPAPAFLEALRADRVLQHRYLVVDKYALTELVELLGGIEIGGVHVNGLQAVAQLSLAWEEPEDLLLRQALIAEEVCRKAPQLANTVGVIDFLKTLSGHYSTDLEMDTMVAGWQGLKDFGLRTQALSSQALSSQALSSQALSSQVPGVSCDFPLMREAMAALHSHAH